MSSSSSIHGHLGVTVVGCTNLMDTELISRRDPYVCLEYGGTKCRTKTCIDGGKNHEFQDQFLVTLVEGHGELQVVVWNSSSSSNSTTHDYFIGGGKVQLEKLFSKGYDVSAWPLQTETSRHAGEIILVLHQANAANEQVASGHASKTLPKSLVPLHYYFAPSSSHPPPLPSPPPPQPAYAASYPPHTAWPVSYPPPVAWPAFYHPHATPYPSYSSVYPRPPYPPTASYPPPPPPPPYTQYHQGNNHGMCLQSLLHVASLLFHALDILYFLGQ